MGRNELCWCGSGLKWKKCHSIRGNLPPLRVDEILSGEKNIRDKSRCLHPLSGPGCGKRIISSHTIQRKAGLKAIEENGHVLSLRHSPAWYLKNDKLSGVERRGISIASTFKGFCDKHDAELFRPVETEFWSATKMNAFLLSFRAICFEFFAKIQHQEVCGWQKSWMDRGKNFWQQVSIQQFLTDLAEGIDLGVKDGNAWKAAYDKMFCLGYLGDYHFLCIDFQPILPVVLCGGMHVEYDFQGKILQELGTNVANLEHLTLNVTVNEKNSICVLGWVGSRDGPGFNFVESFFRLNHDRMSHAIIRLAFEYFENTCIRQSRWEELSPDTKKIAGKRIESGGLGPDGDRTSGCLIEDNLDWFEASPISITFCV